MVSNLDALFLARLKCHVSRVKILVNVSGNEWKTDRFEVETPAPGRGEL